MVKKWVTVQSCNLGIQATEEAKTTHAQTKRNLPSRGKQRGGSGQSTTHAKQQANRGNEERSQEAAEDRERKDTHALEGVRTCLSGVQEGDKDHTMMNTSVREHTAPQQHRKHGVEGKIPTQGQGRCCHET